MAPIFTSLDYDGDGLLDLDGVTYFLLMYDENGELRTMGYSYLARLAVDRYGDSEGLVDMESLIIFVSNDNLETPNLLLGGEEDTPLLGASTTEPGISWPLVDLGFYYLISDKKYVKFGKKRDLESDILLFDRADQDRDGLLT